MLLEIMKNEVLIDDDEITHVEEYAANIKTALIWKGQIEAEVASPSWKLEHVVRWIEVLRSDEIMPLCLESQRVLSRQELDTRNSCSKIIAAHQKLTLKHNNDD